MKKVLTKISVCIMILGMIAVSLASCKKQQLSGSYQAVVNDVAQTWMVTYTFEGDRVEAVGVLSYKGNVTFYEAKGTYEISEDETDQLYITFDFEEETDTFRDANYKFEMGEDYITIISTKYTKVEK